MSMDQWLAGIYGTNAASSDDLEKTAQAVMLEKLAEQEGVSLEGLSEDQLEALAQEVLGAEGGGGVDDQEMAVKEAQAKFEEADFLGRVMAHSYTQELTKIAALSRRDVESAKMSDKNAPGKVRNALNPIRNKVEQTASKGYAAAGKGLRKANKATESFGRKGLSMLSKHRGKAALVGAAGLAAKGIHSAVSGGSEKNASAFDTLAMQRAQEFLDQQGGQDEGQGQEQVSQEEQVKLANAEMFENALNQRAMEMLQAEGYEFDDGGDDQGGQQQ